MKHSHRVLVRTPAFENLEGIARMSNVALTA